MVKNKFFKKAISGITALSLLLPNFANLAVSAEEPEKFQYTMFGRNGITMSVSSNLCMNGNLHTNKDATITAINKNINGKVTTSADIVKRVKHVYADQKIYDTYFTTNCEVHEEEYVYSDMNIHINNPLFCYSNITLDGNVSLNSSLGTLMNINVTGEVKNANNSVVYSKYGNITIENDSTANVNGLIYAPLGTVTINSPNVTINGIIIADQVLINGSSVNINCNDNIARFIGETSEEYNFSGLEYLPEEWLGDTDEDALFDIYEKVIDSDPFNPDTDTDGLPDGYEVLTLGTDPLEIDTDENGILDCDEDFDTDNLNNLGEYQYQTLPFTSDTDEDCLLDGDEVNYYGTIPTDADTDDDKLLDGEEGYNGCIYIEHGVYFDPLNPDTDGNGILDGDEVFGQTKVEEVETYDEAITEVTVDMDTNGNIDRNLTIESMYNIDAMSTNVHALIGEPFNFKTESDFESATITFKIDQSKLGDTQFDNLMILWYNEEEQIFEEMTTTHDIVNSTVSTTTTHFSQYMVVDSEKWYDNWENSLEQLRKMWIGNTSYQKNLHTIILMDCSLNMKTSDPFTDILRVGYNGVTNENIESIRQSIDSLGDVEDYCVKWCDRFEICDGIINNKGGSDATAIITFSNEVISSSGWLYSQSSLRNALDESIGNYGGTANWRSAVNYALSMVETDTTDLYRIIIISDSKANSGVISSDEFASNVILNVVNVGSSSFTNNIEAVVQATGGDVYTTVNASSLTYEKGGFVYIPEQYVGEDSDEDGIPDLVELYGLKPNGDPINTNPNLKDSDGDDIPDSAELLYIDGLLTSDVTIADYIKAIRFNTDPSNPDADGDFDIDGIDPHPTKRLLNDCFIDKITSLERIAYEYTNNNPSYVSEDKYMLGRQYWLIAMFIRHFNSSYVNGSWPQVGGEIDYKFIEYVKNNDTSLYNYFQNQEYIYADYNKGLVDVKHLAATMSVYLYVTDKEDTKFDVDYKHYVKNLAFSYAQTQLPEVIYDCLGGWAGDLQTLMNDTMKSITQIDDYELFYGVLYGLMGDSSASFSMPDLYADTDAYNITLIISLSSYYSNEGFAKAFADYYTDGYTKRFTFFTNGLSEEEYGEIVRLFTDNYLNLGIEIFGEVQEKTIKKKWPLLDYHFSNDQSQAASDAYTAFIFDRVYDETRGD